jgi:hypothetical protein
MTGRDSTLCFTLWPNEDGEQGKYGKALVCNAYRIATAFP